MSLFDEGVEEFLPGDTIQQLVQYIDRICSIALLVEADNILLTNYILCFYEQVGTGRQNCWNNLKLNQKVFFCSK